MTAAHLPGCENVESDFECMVDKHQIEQVVATPQNFSPDLSGARFF